MPDDKERERIHEPYFALADAYNLGLARGVAKERERAKELVEAAQHILEALVESDGHVWDYCCDSMGKLRLDDLRAALAWSEE